MEKPRPNSFVVLLYRAERITHHKCLLGLVAGVLGLHREVLSLNALTAHFSTYFPGRWGRGPRGRQGP
jgi:hypothetical protein